MTTWTVSHLSWPAHLMAIALAALLAGCLHDGSDGDGGGGGGTTTYTVSGTLSGLAGGAQVVLNDNGGDALTLGANGSFTFATAITANGSYSVTVATQPSGQTCSVSAGSGSALAANVTNVAAACVTNPTLTGSVTKVFDFASGQNPFGGLIQASDGKLYGTTRQGGTNDSGTIFRVDLATGSEVTLHSFGPAFTTADGRFPSAGLMQASDGKLYGTTTNGGRVNAGTIFRFDPATGVESVLYSFQGVEADGTVYGLIQASDGHLYGVTSGGGVTVDGTLFRLNLTTLALTILHAFGSGTDGQSPGAGLMQASNGKIYGTTAFGGLHTDGTIFSLDPTTGTYTVIHNAGSNAVPIPNIRHPRAALIQAADGMLYGTSAAGGTAGLGTTGMGTIYRLDPTSNAMTVLHSFGVGTDGFNPQAALIQAGDGKLYGTTSNGGTSNFGTVFRFDLTGVGIETVLYSFGALPDGQNPWTGLVQASDGKLYGTTLFGGANGKGTVFVVN